MITLARDLAKRPGLSRFLARLAERGPQRVRARAGDVPEISLLVAVLLTTAFISFGVIATVLLARIYQSYALGAVVLVVAGILAIRRPRS